MIEFARDVVREVGAESDELRGGTTTVCCGSPPLSRDSDIVLLRCQEEGGRVVDPLLTCVLCDVPDMECLRLLAVDDRKDDVLSGMTATLMTSTFGSTALEDMLCDLDGSEPKLNRLSLLNRTFLCNSRWGESLLEICEVLLETGSGELADLSESCFAILRSVVRLRGNGADSKTMAPIVEVVEMPEALLFSLESGPTELVQPMMLANFSVDAEGVNLSASLRRSRKLGPLLTFPVGGAGSIVC